MPTCSLARLATLVLSLALAASAAPAAVWVVDLGGGGDFTSISAAANAAADGDTLLVRAGNYLGFSGEVLVIGKSLSIVADTDGLGAVVMSPILVNNAPGQRVLLRGLRTKPTPFDSLKSGLVLQGGELWAEDCGFLGSDGFFTIGAQPAAPGAHLSPGTSATFMRCQFVGGRGVDSFFPYAPTPGPGGEGLVALSATVQVYDSDLQGGRGGDFVGFDGGPGPGGVGGHALEGSGSTALVAGSRLLGGRGGNGDEIEPTAGFYRGGDAIELLGASSLRVLDDVLLPGAGGLDGNGAPGPAGVEIDVPSGAVTTHPASYRGYALGAPTPELGTLELEYRGVVGDAFVIFVSIDTAAVPLPGKQGTWQLGSPLFGPFSFGVVTNGNGALDLSIPIPDLGLGVDDALALYEQAFVASSAGETLLSSPTVHVVIDDSL